MAVNYCGAVRMVLALLPHWRERQFGHVVNVSSAGVQARNPKYTSYLPTKVVLDAFSGVVSTETLSDHITFTNMHMPLVRTPMIAPSRRLNPVPPISAEYAAAMVVRGLVEKPARIDTPSAGSQISRTTSRRNCLGGCCISSTSAIRIRLRRVAIHPMPHWTSPRHDGPSDHRPPCHPSASPDPSSAPIGCCRVCAREMRLSDIPSRSFHVVPRTLAGDRMVRRPAISPELPDILLANSLIPKGFDDLRRWLRRVGCATVLASS